MSIKYVDNSQVNGAYGSDIVTLFNTSINVTSGILFVEN